MHVITTKRWKKLVLFLVALQVCILMAIFVKHREISLGADSYYPGISFGDNSTLLRQSYIISTAGCRIPNIDPFDEMLKPIIVSRMNVSDLKRKCGTLPPLTFLTSDNRIVVNESLLLDYGVVNRRHFKCTATAIHTDIGGVKMDGSYHYASNDRDFKDNIFEVTDDHLRVQCFYDGRLIHRDFYATIQRRPELEKRLDDLFKTLTKDVDRLSVLILTLDSVSRVNVHRHMRRTVKFLLETMEAVEMFGYNKMGDNTYPIVVSFLMGLTVSQMQSRCYSRSNKLSGCPFIWRKFSEQGYRTALAEDSFIIDTFHAVGKVGFKQQPTDYYLRPTLMAEYESVPRIMWNPMDYYCFAKRLQAPVLVNYTRDFAATMKDKPYFGYFHSSSLTHDDMNWAQLIDPLVYDFLEECHSGSYLNNTVFMLMSDHGARFGPIRETYMGKLEESLPALFIVFPTWFRQKHPAAMRNLEINSRRLVSSFDIHETLSDILNGHYENERKPQKPDRSSLFDEISENRSCKSAGIPEHYCACQSVDQVSNTTKDAAIAARNLVGTVNGLTMPNRKLCANFTLSYIARIYASKPTVAFSDRGSHPVTSSITDYSVTVVVTPGLARFDGTVRFQGNVLVGVLGEISRIDRYGATAACLSDNVLTKYCWCINQL